MMNLQSPTTLLTSIQFMRSKLRSDKQLLMDIKHDFNQVTRKTNSTSNMEPLAQITNQNQNRQNRDSHSIEHPHKNKIFEVKKEHQREIARLKSQHQIEIEQLKKTKDEEIQKLSNQFQKKIQEQADYILLLQQQVSSPIQTERDKATHDQYDLVINKLLQDNNRLHEQIQKSKAESQKWKKMFKELQGQSGVKSRFKFGRQKRADSKVSSYESQKSHMWHKRVSSVYMFNDQNVDRSNVSNVWAEQWEDEQIQDDEGGLRTIRQFEDATKQGVIEKGEGVRAGGYLSLKI